MNPELDELYQEVILDHSRHPRNFGRLADAAVRVHGDNPACGDEIDLDVNFGADGSLQDIKFSGHGCAISQASASMMTQLVKGKNRGEIDSIRKQFRDLMLGDSSAADDPQMRSLRALSGVARFPARVKCALLAWNALESAMAERSS